MISRIFASDFHCRKSCLLEMEGDGSEVSKQAESFLQVRATAHSLLEQLLLVILELPHLDRISAVGGVARMEDVIRSYEKNVSTELRSRALRSVREVEKFP